MRETTKKIIREATPIELLAVTGGIFAGLLFTSLTNVIVKIPGLLLVIPAFLNMRGGIYASLGSRLSTKLHLGLIEARYTPSGALLEDIFAYVSLSALRIIIQVILAYFISIFIGITVNLIIILIVLELAILISAAMMIPLTIFANIFFFRKGYDPENVIGPILTSSSDIIGFFSIIIAVSFAGV